MIMVSWTPELSIEISVHDAGLRLECFRGFGRACRV